MSDDAHSKAVKDGLRSARTSVAKTVAAQTLGSGMVAGAALGLSVVTAAPIVSGAAVAGAIGYGVSRIFSSLFGD